MRKHSTNRCHAYIFDIAIGSARELAPSEILSADSTDYLLGGSLTLRNGRIDKLQFEEGYCQAVEYSGNASQDDIYFYYYDRDHLGNIRQVVKAGRTTNGTVVQTMDYYPFGAQFCHNSTASEVQSRKYNGKEFDNMHGLNTYDYGARQYNPVTARWDRMDPMCEKYYDVSPYAYCANNPVRYIDMHGDSISFRSLLEYDKLLRTNYTDRIVGDLNSQTGLNLYIENGKLKYRTDSEGNPIVNTGVSIDGRIFQLGSETARSLIISGIDNEQIVEVSSGRKTGVPHESNNIGVNVDQVSSFIEGTSNMDSRTLGWGMTFMHELLHTKVGGGYKDSDIPWQTGSVVDTMNKIRSELNEKGGDYGFRMQYQAVPIHSKAYIPFDKVSAGFVRSGFVPFTKYICF